MKLKIISKYLSAPAAVKFVDYFLLRSLFEWNMGLSPELSTVVLNVTQGSDFTLKTLSITIGDNREEIQQYVNAQIKRKYFIIWSKSQPPFGGIVRFRKLNRKILYVRISWGEGNSDSKNLKIKGSQAFIFVEGTNRVFVIWW